MKLRPKSWEKFQHYKDRCPPWIKLHRDLLNNREFMSLQLASKGLAPLLWLLASETPDGIFDASHEELEFRLRISTKEIAAGIKPLISNGFFEVVEDDASAMLADCPHDAIPEREREVEREVEGETETDKRKRQKRSAMPPVFPDRLNCPTFQNLWEEFRSHRKALKKPMTTQAESMALKRLESLTLSEALMAVEDSISNGWTGIFPKTNKSNTHTNGHTHRDIKRSREYAEPFSETPDILAD